MIYYYIYKITCTAKNHEGEYYYGQRRTNSDPYKDNYYGSGIRIIRYRKKHPNEFNKEIICFCNSQEELNKAEYNIIHPCLNDPKCLNIADGGHGGYTGTHTEETIAHLKEKKQEYYKEHSSWNKGKKMTEEYCQKISESHKGKTTWNKGLKGAQKSWNKGQHGLQVAWNKGISASKEAKQNMSNARLNKRLMTNGKESHFIEEENFEYYISKGYYFKNKSLNKFYDI